VAFEGGQIQPVGTALAVAAAALVDPAALQATKRLA
jgi:hypothetical protein